MYVCMYVRTYPTSIHTYMYTFITTSLCGGLNVTFSGVKLNAHVHDMNGKSDKLRDRPLANAQWTYLLLVEKPFWRHLLYHLVDHEHKPRQCTLCCTGGWPRWQWLLLYYPLCTSSESLPEFPQVDSEL